MKKMGEIDFGPTDARHIIFADKRDQKNFGKLFLRPANVDLKRYLDGRKAIVYGIKGSGKSALLKYLEIELGDSAETRFFYFRRETDKFLDAINPDIKATGEISNTENINQSEYSSFWDAFIFLSLANAMRNMHGVAARSFISEIRRLIGKEESWISSITDRVPILEKFVARISPAGPSVEVEGHFEARRLKRVDADDIFRILSPDSLAKPIYLFFDEMEISFTSQQRFSGEVKLISSLIESIRDFNEVFRRQGLPIYLIAAVRREVSDHILGGDISKIVNDLGQEVGWQRASWSKVDGKFIHPLFEIIIRRIAFSEDRLRDELPQDTAWHIVGERFPRHIQSGNVQKDVLDLTMYRPRDCALLMGLAAEIDSNGFRFRRETFEKDVRQRYAARLWVDVKEALNSKYDEAAIEGIRQVLIGMDRPFYVKEFFDAIDDYSFDPRIANFADRGSDFWIEILRDLFELGALGNLSEDGFYRFRFRGQDALSLSRKHRIVIHQALLRAVS